MGRLLGVTEVRLIAYHLWFPLPAALYLAAFVASITQAATVASDSVGEPGCSHPAFGVAFIMELSLCAVKLFCLVGRRSLLNDLLTFLQKSASSSSSHLSFISSFVLLYTGFYCVLVVSWNTHCLLFKAQMPLPAYFPFDTSSGLGMIVGSSLEVVGIHLAGMTNLLLDCLFPMVIASLRDLMEEATALLESIKGHDSEEDMKKVTLAVDIHSKVLEWSRKLNELYRVILVCQIVCATLFSCFILFTSYKMAEMGFILTSSVPMLIMDFSQLCMYCQSGQALTNQSEKLFGAAYQSEWYACSSEVKNALRMIQLCAKRPITLKAYTKCTASLRLLLTCVQESFSYYLFLINVSAKR